MALVAVQTAAACSVHPRAVYPVICNKQRSCAADSSSLMSIEWWVCFMAALACQMLALTFCHRSSAGMLVQALSLSVQLSVQLHAAQSAQYMDTWLLLIRYVGAGLVPVPSAPRPHHPPASAGGCIQD